jgi:hypothetical protein
VIVEEIAARWESLTGGNSGLHVKAIELFGRKFDGDADFYYLTLQISAASPVVNTCFSIHASELLFLAIPSPSLVKRYANRCPLDSRKSPRLPVFSSVEGIGHFMASDLFHPS